MGTLLPSVTHEIFWISAAHPLPERRARERTGRSEDRSDKNPRLSEKWRAQHVSDRLLQFQDKLDFVQTKIRAEAPPTLPAAETIRSMLPRLVNEAELSGDIERQPTLFKPALNRECPDDPR